MESTPATASSQRRLGSSSHVLIRTRGNVMRATFSGPRIGEQESESIARDLHAAIATGRGLKHLVLDLSAVTTMSSLGLGMCIDVRNAARKRGIETIIMGLCAELADLVRMMKVDRLYTVVAGEAELRERLAR